MEARPLNGLSRTRPLPASATREFKLIVLLTLLHIPLGISLYNVGPLAILHPLAAFLVGLKWAIRKDVRLAQVALAAGYIIGAEVLWRMAGVPVFWEFGKYGSAIIMVVALIRRSSIRIPHLPLVYFVALLPSCILTLIQLGASGGKEMVSTNLSGPFLLVVSALFFSNTSLSLVELRRLCIAIVIPLVSVGCVSLFYTVSTENIVFNGESNFVTSGGFGPNQVSGMLGLGAFIAVLCLIILRNKFGYKFYFALAALLCTIQGVMTFSRGGIYNAVGAILAVTLWELRKPSRSLARLAPLLIAALLFVAFVFPVLNNFTGGALEDRYNDVGTAKREDLAEADVQIFYENPVMGVGVGMAYDYREQFLGYKGMSHTEFSRLLSEHGTFGILAIISLIAMAVLNIRKQRSPVGQAFIIGAAAWCVLFMLNSGMRLAAPSFIWGLTFATVVSATHTRRTRRTVAHPLRTSVTDRPMEA